MTELRLSRDFLVEVALGNVLGFSIIEKFGKHPDLDTNDGFQSLWNGAPDYGSYTGFNATAGETIEVFSDSGSDAGTLVDSGTATGGTSTTLISSGISGLTAGDVLINDTQDDHGIVVSSTSTVITVWRFQNGTIPVSGDAWRVATKASTGAPVMRLSRLIDAAFGNDKAEYVILNGTSSVYTTGTYMRSSRGRLHGGDGVGEITARQSTTTANVFIVMPAGENSTFICADTIPAGYTGYIIDWFASLSEKTSANVDVRGRVRPVGDVFQTISQAGARSTGTSFLTQEFIGLKGPVPEMSDISMEAETDSNNTVVSGGWSMLLVDNNYTNKAA